MLLIVTSLFYGLCYELAEFLKDVAEVDLLRDDRMEILDLHALLLHRITMADGHATVIE